MGTKEQYFEEGGKLMTHDMWGNKVAADLDNLKQYDQWGNESSAAIGDIELKDEWGNPYRLKTETKRDYR
tara:strand:- start:559 stop:768 length:210 start_codon:yes stop_codon:yes gene_type:complete